ncbi:MAG: ribulose-phosphate 3-epimerase [Nanoarchaeota archaeon]|nr:ribulose-phosphate 3-epimerase [Nanoarchaeota archaeon]
MRIKIAPSILSADKDNLQKEVEEIEPYADLIHVDIMDGKFVPPITFLPDEIKNIDSKLPKDVHLMVSDPEKSFIDDYAEAGASIITIHAEACGDITKTIEKIKNLNIKAGLSINPPTPLEKILPYIGQVDMVLIMSVNPGYAGQKFIPEVLEKIRKLRQLKPELDIEIDGGINKDTIKQAVDAGANVIVAGSAIFNQKNRKKAIDELREASGI